MSGRHLTTAQRGVLDLAVKLGGSIRVYPDQLRAVVGCETLGYMTRSGSYFSPVATITAACLRAQASIIREAGR